MAQQRRISRRSIIRNGAIGAGGLAGAALLGCTSGDDDGTPASSDGGTPPAGATSAATPESGDGGTLRWGLKEDLVALEPHTFTGDLPGATLYQIWDNLTEYDSDYQPQARLAESWEINEDYTEFVLHLRSGVKWHSGRDFTSDDVAYNMDRVVDPELPFGQLKAMRELFDAIEIPDESTVILRAPTPRPATFDFLEYLSIGDRDSLEGGGELLSAGGTGPYIYEEWRPGDRFQITKNPDYWEEGLPHVDEQTFALSLDPQTMVAQFEAGASDIILAPTVRDYVRLRDAGGYQPLSHPKAGSVFGAGFNTVASGGTPIEFTDKRVRQALNWAIDRQRFTEVIVEGTVEPISLPWPEGSLGYYEDQHNHYEFDLEKARQLLDAAGVSSLDFRILTYTGLPEQIEFAQIYQEDLASLGVTIELDVVENAAFVDLINADPPAYNGMYFAPASRGHLTPITTVNLGSVSWSPNIAGEFEGRTYGDNNTGYYNPEYSDVIANLNVEVDVEKQRELYRQFNDLILDDCFYATIAFRPLRIVAQSNVMGIEPDAGRSRFKTRGAYFA